MRVAPRAALQAHDFQPGVGQLFREDGAGEPDADRDDVDRFEFGRHAYSYASAPGFFKYFVLIASSAWKVSAPTVPVGL